VVKERLERSNLADEAAWLWHEDETERFSRLAARYPDLLTYQEQVVWKRVRDEPKQLAE
jgi:hypothetical protein